jgi:hypothetical protein
MLYSVETGGQFVNTADDRARGKGATPFGNFKDFAATALATKHPPYPGDEAFFTFSIYTSPTLKTRAGSAVLSCTYNFGEDAFCDASYQLDSGSLYGSAAFNFNTSAFVVALTGGTGKYLDTTGNIDVTPGPAHSQRLAFEFG